MALRDQPYFPLYVQDYLSDEKLSCCSLSSQGVYIRILCVLHKSETYGGILFKQIPKQNLSSIQYFAFIISKQIGCTLQEVTEAIEELLFFEVLKIKQVDGVDFLYQKRMVIDFEVSLKRSEAAKKGGGNPKLKKDLFKQTSKQTSKQTVKQNPEYEYVYENENENENVLIGVQQNSKNKNTKICIEVLKYLNELSGRKIEVDNEVNHTYLLKRISEGATEEQLREVVELKVYQWKNDDKMRKFLHPDTLFNKSKFYKYKNECHEAKSNPTTFRKESTIEQAERINREVLQNFGIRGAGNY